MANNLTTSASRAMNNGAMTTRKGSSDVDDVIGGGGGGGPSGGTGGAMMGGGGGGGGGGAGAVSISSKPTLITSGKLRFLIMDAPRQSNLHLYIRECKRNRVTDVVRVCEPTYHGGELSAAGMRLHEMAYDDGRVPPPEVLDGWLDLVEERFFPPASSSSSSSPTTTTLTGAENVPPANATATTTTTTTIDSGSTIAVHCVAGLGRAPVLVAIALMEYENMDAIDAVTMIRRSRRGAINENQLQYLEGYRRRRRGRKKKRNGEEGCGCSIM